MPLLSTFSAASVRGFRGGKFLPPPPSFVNYSTTQNSANASSLVLNKPASTVDNNLLVAFAFLDAGATSRTFSFPAGWTMNLGSASTVDPHIGMGSKIAASEGSSYTITDSVSTDIMGGIILTFSGAVVDVVGSLSSQAADPVAPSITVTNDNSVVLAIFANRNSSQGCDTPAGWTLIASSNTTGASWAVFSKQLNAGATGTLTLTGNGASGASKNMSSAMLVSLSPPF